MVQDSLFRLMADQVRDYAVFLLDPQGNVMSWNLGAQLAKGYSASEIIGKHFSTFYTPEAVASKWPQHELAEATREGRFEDEGWRIRKDGTRFWANVVITALRDETGKLVAFSKITRDLSTRRRHEEELRQSEERFRLLVEGVVDYAVYMLDPDGTVTSWNAGAERIKGYQRTEIIGRHYSNFFTPEEVAAGKPWEELTVARRDGRAEVHGWRVRKDGSRFWARAVVTALYDPRGNLRGFAKVTQDLTQQRQLSDLEAARSKLNEFIAMLAHEIRNPLAPLESALQVVRNAAPGDPLVPRMLDIIERQSRRLSRIAGDMADISRVTRGALSIDKKPLFLADVVAAAAEAAEPLVKARRHTLHIDVDRHPIEGDHERLVQVFSNLIGNAAKYTPPGGRITVRSEQTPEHIRVSVRDTGKGIAQDDLETIFTMFVQGRAQLDRASAGGMGVGLALSRSVIEAHGGSIHAESEGTGKGAELVVILPLSGALPAAAPARASLFHRRAGMRARRILIVDDNRDAAVTLEELLRALGHETLTVHDGPEALSAFDSFHPDLVLLDIGLPTLSGYEVARQIRSRRGNVRIVAITGWGQAEDRRMSADAGFDLHLVKPIDEAGLLAALKAENGNGTVH